MSTVLAMRVHRDQAILIADESTWHLGHIFGYRRTNYGDALAPLTSSGPVTAAYAGVGFPSMHDEAARAARRALEAAPPSENDDVSRAAHEAFLAAHHRLVDDKLRFDYGFTLAELNARKYRLDGAERKINQGSVVAAARAMAGGGGGGNASARIFSNSAFVVSHDAERGIQGWYLEPKGRHMGFTSPLAVIGDGDAVASHLIAQFLERRHLGRRREGFSTKDGLYVAMRIAAEVQGRVGSMGGYLQVMFLDGEAGLSERADDACHLATEITRAHLWGFLDRGTTAELLSGLLREGASVDDAEARLFEAAGDRADQLTRYLVGFKPDAAPGTLDIDPVGGAA